MRKLLLLIGFISVLSIWSCSKKGCTPVQPEVEESTIKAFASKYNFAVTKHSNGVYFQVLDPGTGTAPTSSSKVSVTYVGKLMSGSVFDSATTPVTIDLRDVIEGWQLGLPLIKKGGHIRLLIPSAYAYGCNGNGMKNVPPDSVLFFDINLYDVW